jgi:hypothetical protein
VRFIVRVETGTINRGIYQIAMLHDPYTEGAPTWARHPAGWNGKLIYQHGGGCQGGWYIQGTVPARPHDGGISAWLHGASSSLNVFGNNCNDLPPPRPLPRSGVLTGAYGVPKYTTGTGSSGARTRAIKPR